MLTLKVDLAETMEDISTSVSSTSTFEGGSSPLVCPYISAAEHVFGKQLPYRYLAAG